MKVARVDRTFYVLDGAVRAAKRQVLLGNAVVPLFEVVFVFGEMARQQADDGVQVVVGSRVRPSSGCGLSDEGTVDGVG